MADDSTATTAPPTRECPTVEQLTSPALGTDARTQIFEHLAGCTHCSAIVAKTRPSDAGLAGQLLPPDTMVGRYRIVQRIGHGGMGVVYLAVDTELDREVALKLVRSRGAASLDELTERLRRESRLQARTKHPCVITVHDIGRDGDRVYVAMELARGGTLRAWFTRTPRSWREVLGVFRRAGQGLAAAHAAGLVHRDFKPDNVLVEEDRERVTRVLVSDFGLARAVEAAERPSVGDMASAAASGVMAGTPAYMAPEQLAGNAVDVRADVFAFGVSLWEALYGARPYAGNSMVQLMAEMVEQLPTAPSGHGVPRWLERVLRRALAIDPAKRYASMAEVLHVLDWRRRRRQLWVVGAAAVLLAAAGTTLVVARVLAPLSPCDRESEGVATLRAASARLRLAAVGDQAPRRDLWAGAFDKIASTSERLRIEACHATPRPMNQADRVRCLDSRTGSAAAFADVLARSPVARTQLVVQQSPLEPPYECRSDVAGVLANEVPARARRAAVAEVEVELKAAAAIARTDHEASARQLSELLERARALGISSVVDEVMFERAWVRRDEPSAKDTFREVAVAARRDGATAVAAQAWLAMVGIDFATDNKAVRDQLVQADIAVDLAGNPPRLSAYWHAYSARAYAIESKTAETAREVAASEQATTSGDVTPDLGLAGVLADAEMRVGDLSAALARYARAFEQITPVLAPDEDAAPLRVHYALALIVNRDFDKALEVVAPVIAALDPSRPVSSAEATAIALTANVYIRVARYADAEHLLTRWQPAVDRSLGPQVVESATLVYEQAAAALALGSLDVAEHASADALERDVEIFGASGHNTAIVRVVHGHALFELGHVAAARDDLERAVKDLTATGGKADPFKIEGQVLLAEVYLGEHNPAAALALLEATIEPYRESQPDPPSMAGAELALAEALVATNGDLARARALVDHALSLWATQPAGSTGDIARAKALRAKLGK